MRVIADPRVSAFVSDHGGRLFVRTDRRRCCSGGMTYLAAALEPEAARSHYRRIEVDGFELWFAHGRTRSPDELHLEIRGRRHPHVEAYWNGCLFAA